MYPTLSRGFSDFMIQVLEAAYLGTSACGLKVGRRPTPRTRRFRWDPYRAEALTQFLNTLRPRPTTIPLHTRAVSMAPQEAQASLTAAGYDVVDNIAFTAGAADFTPVIDQVKSAHADVFYWLGYPGDNVLMAQQAKAEHLNVKLMVDVAAGETLAQYGTSAQGLVSLDVFNVNVKENIPKLRQWVTGISQVEHVTPEGGAAQGYAGMITLLDAMKNAKSTDQAKVIQHLSHAQFWTPCGTIGYRSDIPGHKHQLLLPSDQVVYQYRGPTSVVVWPKSKANGSITYPAN